jgi:predicted XRE-type DNA-binding protein
MDTAKPAVRNAFELLTKDPVQFNMLSVKSKLVMTLVDMIKKRGWTQKDAAQHLNVTQPRISNLFQGKLDKFSVDTLLEMIVLLGFKLDMTYRPHNEEEPLEMKLKKAML